MRKLFIPVLAGLAAALMLTQPTPEARAAPSIDPAVAGAPAADKPQVSDVVVDAGTPEQVQPAAPAVAVSPAPVPAPDDTLDLAARALDAFAHHDWPMLGGIVLLLISGVLIARKGIAAIPGKLGAFARSTFGGTVILFLGSAAGGFGSALMAHRAITGSLAVQVVFVAVAAAGGWHALLKPLLDKLGLLDAVKPAAEPAK